MSLTPAKLAKIRTAIVATLNKPSVGIFYSHERSAKRDRDFYGLYGTPVKGGFIRKVGSKTTQVSIERSYTRLRFEITYYMAFSDENESQLSFEDNLQTLQDEFLQDDDLVGLPGVTHVVDDTAGLEETDNQPVLFAGLLCHRSKMVLQVQCYH